MGFFDCVFVQLDSKEMRPMVILNRIDPNAINENGEFVRPKMDAIASREQPKSQQIKSSDLEKPKRTLRSNRK